MSVEAGSLVEVAVSRDMYLTALRSICSVYANLAVFSTVREMTLFMISLETSPSPSPASASNHIRAS